MIGIIGAMEQEVSQLQSEMENVEKIVKAQMTFYKGKLCGQDAVVVQSGIGKVNAGICAQILVDNFEVTALINTGVAGALDNRLNIGDMVISTDAVQHDMDVVPLGYAKGQIPGVEVLAFPADAELVEKAVEANKEANPEIGTFTGRVASGDQFIAEKGVKDGIINNFQAMCAEMEGAAIAQTAYLNQVSYVIIRAISDKADNSATMDYPAFEREAIVHSVRLVKNLMGRM